MALSRQLTRSLFQEELCLIGKDYYYSAIYYELLRQGLSPCMWNFESCVREDSNLHKFLTIAGSYDQRCLEEGWQQLAEQIRTHQDFL